MIKRFCFVTRRQGLSVHDFTVAWIDAVASIMGGPASVRPVRAVACTTLHDVPGTEIPHDGICIVWCSDLGALLRFETWLHGPDGERTVCAADLIDPSATGVFVAEERVLRGADWLTRRWASSAVKLKHMALARRAKGLRAETFSERWRNRAGAVGGGPKGPAVTIPDAAKGLAYLQNHALSGSATPSRYDAVNEVYFDDLTSLRDRADFFGKLDVAGSEADLVSAATFVAVAEHVV